MLPTGPLIKAAREAEPNMTITNLAELTGLDRTVLGRIEKGEVGVSPYVFHTLLDVLRALSPKALLDAVGYGIAVPDAERISRPLVRAILEADPRDWPAIEELALARTALRRQREAMSK